MVTPAQPSRTAWWLKIAGAAFVLIPVGVLLYFAVGEMAGGELGGLGYLIQALPMMLLVVVAWLRPRLGGSLMVALGVVLTAFTTTFYHGTASDKILGALFMFGPLVVSGLLFLAADRGVRAPQPRT